MTNSENSIDVVFKEVIQELGEYFQKAPWEDRNFYACWLAQTYLLVRHTPRYLALSAGKYGINAEDAHRHALDHLREENGHDVLARKDLEHLGFTITDFPELPHTTALYQGQYYWIEMQGPTSHLGYALMLEGLASDIGSWFHQTLQKSHGDKACRFIAVHAHEDVDHFAHGLEHLKTMTRADRDRIIENLLQSRMFYESMLEAIKEASRHSKRNEMQVA